MYFFFAAAFLSFVGLCLRGAGGHWLIFSGAAQALWRKENPHGLTFGSDAGFWFYSPNCGLSLYGPFAFLPHNWGQGLFMGLSWLVLVSGVWKFWKLYEPDLRVTSKRFQNFVWIAASSEIIGTFLNARIEVLILGILFWSLALWRSQKLGHEIFAMILLAMVSEWKSQTLLIAFLWLLKAHWRHRISFVAAFLVWHLWPTLHLGWDPFWEFESQRRAGLEAWMLSPYRDFENWLSYQQIYTFFFKTFGWHMHLSQTVWISLPVIMGMTLYFWRQRVPSTLLPLLATILGMYFANAYLPLSQSSGFALYIPCLLWFLYFEKKPRWILLGLLWFGVSGLYSDFVPRAWRIWAFEHAIKAATLALFPVILILSRKKLH